MLHGFFYRRKAKSIGNRQEGHPCGLGTFCIEDAVPHQNRLARAGPGGSAAQPDQVRFAPITLSVRTKHSMEVR